MDGDGEGARRRGNGTRALRCLPGKGGAGCRLRWQGGCAAAGPPGTAATSSRPGVGVWQGKVLRVHLEILLQTRCSRSVHSSIILLHWQQCQCPEKVLVHCTGTGCVNVPCVKKLFTVAPGVLEVPPHLCHCVGGCWQRSCASLGCVVASSHPKSEEQSLGHAHWILLRSISICDILKLGYDAAFFLLQENSIWSPWEPVESRGWMGTSHSQSDRSFRATEFFYYSLNSQEKMIPQLSV